MPKKARELAPLEVRRLTKPGRWSVGGVDGLALQIASTGSRSWVLRITVAGRQREMGLGSFPTVTLAGAREAARRQRAQVAEGIDPVSMRIAAASALKAERSTQLTFADMASQYIAQHANSWKNQKHGAQWASTLNTYAFPILGKLLTRDISTAHVISVLDPIWAVKTETATRVRSRIELVLDFAAARGVRAGPNPARWKGNLDAALPKPSKVAKVSHHAAISVAAISHFMVELRRQNGVGARALELAILTAARSGEVRGLTWAEIDLENKLWIVPAARMKAGREHRVPLSKPAVRLLRSQSPGGPEELVFKGMRGALSDMSMTAVLRRMEVEATAHGFRSTFRDWVAERTTYSSEVAEMALAHAVSDKVEAAYRRGDLYEKRVLLMSDWASFLSRRPA